jgi:hypothetical protein
MDPLQRSLHRIRLHAPVFAELQGVWEHTQTEPLWWDRHYNVLVRIRSGRAAHQIVDSPHLRFLAGTMRSLRSGDLRRWIGPIDLGLVLPPDAVVVRPYVRWSPVVISPTEGLVLKLFRDAGPKHENEVQALLIAREHGLDANTQQIVDHGRTAAGIPWMTSRLALNTRIKMARHWPFLARLWSRWLREEGLPFLHRYYSAAGYVTESSGDLRDRAVEAVRGQNDPSLVPLLQKLTSLRLSLRPDTVFRTRIHGDLSPAHVHRDPTGWRLIDWGDSHIGTLFREMLRGPWDQLEVRKSHHRAFWDWLAGHSSADSLPPPLAPAIGHLAFFHRAFLRVDLTAEEIRDHTLCVMVLEDTGRRRPRKLHHLARLMEA